MGLRNISNMSQAQQSGGMNMNGLMQMLGLMRQMRAANGGQSPFGGKGAARTQQAQPAGVNRFLPQQGQQSMFQAQMPQAPAFQPVQQPAPRVMAPPPAAVPPMASLPPKVDYTGNPIVPALGMSAQGMKYNSGGMYGPDGSINPYYQPS